MKTYTYKGQEPDELNFEQEANADVKDLNKDFLYDFKFRQDKRPKDPTDEFDTINMKRLKEFA
jgi:hypothetical protein